MKKIGLLMILLFGFYSEANASDNKFLSLHYEYYQRFEDNIDGRNVLGLWGVSYGHSIISQSKYYGFFSTGMKFYVKKFQDIGGGQESSYLSLGSFFDLQYGYEFMRNHTFSFGINTSLSMGVVANDKGTIGGKLGIFGRWKATESFSILIQTGLGQYNSPTAALKEIVNDTLFGPYAQVELRSYL